PMHRLPRALQRPRRGREVLTLDESNRVGGGGKEHGLMEQSQVSFARETHRCPYCHEDVAVNDDEWVACKQCLARHHLGCWTEGSRCSACQGGTPLVHPTT